MDVAALSMNLAEGGLMQQVGLKVLDNAMEMNEVVGQGVVEMIDSAAMERSVNPAVGANFDLRI